MERRAGLGRPWASVSSLASGCVGGGATAHRSCGRDAGGAGGWRVRCWYVDRLWDRPRPLPSRVWDHYRHRGPPRPGTLRAWGRHRDAAVGNQCMRGCEPGAHRRTPPLGFPPTLKLWLSAIPIPPLRCSIEALRSAAPAAAPTGHAASWRRHEQGGSGAFSPLASLHWRSKAGSEQGTLRQVLAVRGLPCRNNRGQQRVDVHAKCLEPLPQRRHLHARPDQREGVRPLRAAFPRHKHISEHHACMAAQ